MANEQNLLKAEEMTSEELRERARKGGIASAKARQARKSLKEELLLLLSQGNTQEKISLSLIQQAMEGNVKAYETIRDTVGEKPVDKLEAKVEETVINIKLDDEI